MAKTFTRFPIIGGDLNSWASYNDAQNELSLGLISSKLYDNSGSLYISSGKIGISDGTYKGVIALDAAESISLSGVANGIWARIEVYLSGISVTIVASEISGEISENDVPVDTLTASYNPIKGGYYNTSSRRTIGLVFKDSNGNLSNIVNCLSFDHCFGAGINGINQEKYRKLIAKYVYGGAGFTANNDSGYDPMPLDVEKYNYITGADLSTGGNILLPKGLYLMDVNYTARTVGNSSPYNLYSRLNAYHPVGAFTYTFAFPDIQQQLVGVTTEVITYGNLLNKQLVTINEDNAEVFVSFSVGILDELTITDCDITIEKIDGE